METLTQDFTYQIDYTHTQSLSLSLSKIILVMVY